MVDVIAAILLDVGAVRFNAAKPFTYSSGLRSPIYCDLRLIMSHPPQREIVIRELIGKIGDTIGLSNVDVVSGTATAGIPFASWIADRLHLPMIYVRSEKKSHGLGNKIEGRLKESDRVLVVEDIVSSGKSSLGNIASVREAGAGVAGTVAVASYELEQSMKRFADAGVRLEYLTDMNSVIKEANERGVLSSAEVKVVQDWLQDPWGWYERQGFA